MRLKPYYLQVLAAGLAIGFTASIVHAQQPTPIKPPSPKDGMEVDARGPIHEAFAQPYQASPAPNEPVDKKPPDPVPEEPAAQKPEGKNVLWIPGYWQFDTDRKDYVWVSGIWRDVPDGRRWIMGYWTKTPDGYRWVSGHYAATQEKDNQYVPEPPESKDKGPTTKPPDENSLYIPGNNFYGDNGYTWRDGYWTDAAADQVWVPARYNWSPYGYVFASGYWDYPLARRGLLFAPVYFTAPLWQTAGWVYRPSFAIGSNGLYGSLFVGLGWGHYYYGDYYNRSYLNFGITPWYWYSNRWYDPIWNHDRWANRSNPQWANSFQTTYNARVNGTQPLPPRTFAAQATAGANAPRMVTPLAQAQQAGLKLTPVTAEQRATQLQTARQMSTQAHELGLKAGSSTSTSNRVNVGGTPGVAPRTVPPGPASPNAPPAVAPHIPTGTLPNVQTPAPHIPTGTLQNMHQPTFNPPHPGGFPGGHGGGNGGKPPHK